MVKLVTKLQDILNINEKTLGVFLDLSKAFDTVNHALLLDSLESIGIRGKAHNLLRSYVHNRMQKVRIGDALGFKRPVTCGVLQGTILGRILLPKLPKKI